MLLCSPYDKDQNIPLDWQVPIAEEYLQKLKKDDSRNHPDERHLVCYILCVTGIQINITINN